MEPTSTLEVAISPARLDVVFNDDEELFNSGFETAYAVQEELLYPLSPLNAESDAASAWSSWCSSPTRYKAQESFSGSVDNHQLSTQLLLPENTHRDVRTYLR